MKIEALKEYIRKTVQQEVRNILQEELKFKLAEILIGNNSTVVSPTKKQIPNKQSLKSFMEDSGDSLVTESKKEELPKKKVKYCNNEVLNDVLNQTTNKIPSESGVVDLSGGGFGDMMGRQTITENKIPENAPEPVKTVYSAMNRDYRSLMKAVDKKKNK